MKLVCRKNVFEISGINAMCKNMVEYIYCAYEIPDIVLCNFLWCVKKRRKKDMQDLWNNVLYQKELDTVFLSNTVWEKLYGKKLLITGTTGMIGSFLVDTLMKKNELLQNEQKIDLLVTTRNVEYAKERFLHHMVSDNFHLLKLDVTNIEHELDNLDFDYIIVGAGSADPEQFAKNPVDTMESNLYGLTNLLEIAKNRQHIRVLYISTGEIYGNAGTDVESFKEDDSFYVNSTDVRACYPNSKRAAETFCAAYHTQYDVDVVIGRLCYVYGPTIKESDSRSVAQFLQKAARGENIKLKSRGEQIRSYCYIVDAVAALLFLLVCGVSGEAYNIANADSNCSIAEFADMIARTAGVKCTHAVAEEREKAGYSRVAKAVQCPDKINALGWKAEVSLKNGIESTVKVLQG